MIASRVQNSDERRSSVLVSLKIEVLIPLTHFENLVSSCKEKYGVDRSWRFW